MENSHGSTILFYRRYVDDTFCLLLSEHDAIIFFDYRNSRQPNTRFAIEKEVEVYHKLQFLDVLINSHNPKFSLGRVYREETFTELLTNCFYQVGLIKTLVDRAHKIYNTWLGSHEDITKLMDILK